MDLKPALFTFGAAMLLLEVGYACGRLHNGGRKVEAANALDFAIPAQKEARLFVWGQPPTTGPSSLVWSPSTSQGYYALGTRCDETIPGGSSNCRLWHIAASDYKTSIRYDRDTNELWRCGEMRVYAEEPTKDCVPMEASK